MRSPPSSATEPVLIQWVGFGLKLPPQVGQFWAAFNKQTVSAAMHGGADIVPRNQLRQ